MPGKGDVKKIAMAAAEGGWCVIFPRFARGTARIKCVFGP